MKNEITYAKLINDLKNADKNVKEAITVSEIVSNIISDIIHARLDQNMSQRDFAKLVGMKQPAIARIERLQVIPRLDTVAKLAYHLNLDLAFRKDMRETHYIVINDASYSPSSLEKMFAMESSFDLDLNNQEYNYKPYQLQYAVN